MPTHARLLSLALLVLVAATARPLAASWRFTGGHLDYGQLDPTPDRPGPATLTVFTALKIDAPSPTRGAVIAMIPVRPGAATLTLGVETPREGPPTLVACVEDDVHVVARTTGPLETDRWYAVAMTYTWTPGDPAAGALELAIDGLWSTEPVVGSGFPALGEAVVRLGAEAPRRGSFHGRLGPCAIWTRNQSALRLSTPTKSCTRGGWP